MPGRALEERRPMRCEPCAGRLVYARPVTSPLAACFLPSLPVVELAEGHVKLIKVWLARGPDVAKKWARLRCFPQRTACIV